MRRLMLCERWTLGKGTRAVVLGLFPMNHVYQACLSGKLESCSRNRLRKWEFRKATASNSFSSVRLQTLWSCRHTPRAKIGVASVCFIGIWIGIGTASSPTPTTAYRKNFHSFTRRSLYLRMSRRNISFPRLRKVKNPTLAIGAAFTSLTWKMVQRRNSQARISITLPPGTERGWICEILSFGDSGLFVKAALSKNEAAFEYFVAELDATQNVKPTAALPAVFM
jgi:hypothetical protein